MKILVYVLNEIKNNKKLIEMKEIICPECNENVEIKINDYKLDFRNIIIDPEYKNKCLKGNYLTKQKSLKKKIVI